MKDSYSVPEVAEILATSRQQVRLLISLGKLKAWNMGIGTVRKRWRVNIEDLNKFTGK